MGRMYSAVISAVASPAVNAFDAFEVVAPADAAVIVHSINIEQGSDTDSEQVVVTVQRATGSGSGGSATTPNPLSVGNPAFGGTVETMNTTVATTLTKLFESAFNVLNGWMHIPTPECRYVISPSGRLVVTVGAHVDAITISGTIVFEEVGG